MAGDGVLAGDGGCAGCAEAGDQIAMLQEALAREQARGDVLESRLLQAEEAQAEQDVDSFGDVIPNEDRGYYRGLFILNREGTRQMLNRLRGRTAPKAPAAAAPVPVAKPAAPAPAAPRPLHNREKARPAVAGPAAGGSVETPEARGLRLRNRAVAIMREKNIAFVPAWAQAEKE